LENLDIPFVETTKQEVEEKSEDNKEEIKDSEDIIMDDFKEESLEVPEEFHIENL
jgi:hypothetical protein